MKCEAVSSSKLRSSTTDSEGQMEVKGVAKGKKIEGELTEETFYSRRNSLAAASYHPAGKRQLQVSQEMLW